YLVRRAIEKRSADRAFVYRSAESLERVARPSLPGTARGCSCLSTGGRRSILLQKADTLVGERMGRLWFPRLRRPPGGRRSGSPDQAVQTGIEKTPDCRRRIYAGYEY